MQGYVLVIFSIPALIIFADSKQINNAHCLTKK